MQLTVERQGNVDVLTATGSIHSGDDADFGKKLTELRREQRFHLVIDASGLEYINSRAIGHLVQFSRDARLAGGKVVLVKPGPSVEKILKAVGLLSLIPSYDSTGAAIAACAPDA
jgi:anti-anti-sigma factor